MTACAFPRPVEVANRGLHWLWTVAAMLLVACGGGPGPSDEEDSPVGDVTSAVTTLNISSFSPTKGVQGTVKPFGWARRRGQLLTPRLGKSAHWTEHAGHGPPVPKSQ
jgi:hypothetical protein